MRMSSSIVPHICARARARRSSTSDLFFLAAAGAAAAVGAIES